jgi:hypothetical protein
MEDTIRDIVTVMVALGAAGMFALMGYAGHQR